MIQNHTDCSRTQYPSATDTWSKQYKGTRSRCAHVIKGDTDLGAVGTNLGLTAPVVPILAFPTLFFPSADKPVAEVGFGNCHGEANGGTEYQL